MGGDPGSFLSLKHSCKQSETHVTLSLASGSHAGRFVASPCNRSKEEHTSCPQSLASCCNVALGLSGKSSLNLWLAAAQSWQGRPLGRFLPWSLPQAPTFPLPAHLLRLQHVPVTHPCPTPTLERSSSPLRVGHFPHSLEYSSAFSCLLPWTLTVVQQTVMLTQGH